MPERIQRRRTKGWRMPEISIGQLGRDLSATIRRVREDGEVVAVTRHGEPVARIVPHEGGGAVVAHVQGAKEDDPRLEAG
jgi:prevent-host-death family protein